MLSFLGFILFLTAIALAGLMLYQHWTGSHPLFSLRNISLVGFMGYQLTSAGTAMLRQDYSVFAIRDPEGAGLEFTAMALAFLVIFLVAYEIGFPAKQAAARTPMTRLNMGGSSLLLLAFALTIGAGVLRFGVLIPYIGIIAGWVGIGFGSVATGIVAWVWSRAWYNPVLFVTAGIVTLVNTGIAISGQFGRRQLAAIGLAFVWGAFYGRLRFQPMIVMLQTFAIVAAPAVVALALFTSVRGKGAGEVGAVEQFKMMAQGSVKEGLIDLLGGQGTGPTAMWTIENYPERFNGGPYQTITYTFTHNIPRALWEGKPEPLSKDIATNADVKGVAQENITIPPGIVGYAAAEGGLPALAAYAIFFAVILRYFDELVRRNPYTPLVVLPIACQLGQIIGLFRGDPALFINIYIYSFVGCYFTCTYLGKAIEARAAARGGVFEQATAEQDEMQRDLLTSLEEGDAGQRAPDDFDPDWLSSPRASAPEGDASGEADGGAQEEGAPEGDAPRKPIDDQWW